MEQNTYIRDHSGLENKIKFLKRSGNEKLHIISDFDGTLTQPQSDGKLITSYIMVESSILLAKGYKERSKERYDRYSPIELDINMLLDEKAKLITQWWHESLSDLVASGMSRLVITDALIPNATDLNINGSTALNSRIIMKKEKVDGFFEVLTDNNIPLLIFSAGLGDIITNYLDIECLSYDKMHVLANFFEFDKNGLATGYKEPVVTSVNKNEGLVNHEKYLKEIEGRKNVILLGDQLEDNMMADGLKHDCVLKIGFASKKEDVDAFSKVYDVVVINGNSMGYVNMLLGEIV